MSSDEKYTGLIIKYLTKEISDSERDELIRMKSESTSHAQLFDDYKKLWKYTQAASEPEIEDINLDAEWYAFKGRVKPNIALNKKRISLYRYAGVAVAAIVIAGLFLFFFFQKETRYLYAENEVQTAYLPDSTMVDLNLHSKLSYTDEFSEKRHVNLEGEAYFSVVSDSENPFVVHTENYMITVVGTRFFVSTGKSFEVIVNEGVVDVYEPETGSTKRLEAGQRYAAETSAETVVMPNTNQNFLAWKTGKIVFEDSNLDEITKVLERTYGKKILSEVKDSEGKRLSVTFENQDLNTVLQVLQTTLNVNIRKEQDTIIIY